MTIEQLIEELAKLPKHQYVYIEADKDYSSIHSVRFDSRVGVILLAKDSLIIQ